MARSQEQRVSPWSADPVTYSASDPADELRNAFPYDGASPALALQHHLVSQFEQFNFFAGLELPPRSRLYHAIERGMSALSRAAGPILLVGALGGIVYLLS
jgi:hypothetical protein